MDRTKWDITNKPHTQKKLEIIKAVFETWLQVWCAPKQLKWAAKEWYVIDLFAGTGVYYNNNREVSGSSIILLENILLKKDVLIKNHIKIKVILVEEKKQNFDELTKRVEILLNEHKDLNEIVEVIRYQNDCNIAINDILKQVKNYSKNPLFVFIDPCGIQIKKETIEKLANLNNKKDILLNYILEGVKRVGGVYQKSKTELVLNSKAIKTIETLKEFFGEDLSVMEHRKNDRDVLNAYVQSFAEKNLNITGFEMKYPNRNDALYYLLFVCKQKKIIDAVKDIFYRKEQKYSKQPSLFGKEEAKQCIYTKVVNKELDSITRKTLLYKTKVEYGDWTINHILGCSHGCNFPCYAMLMAKRFGWIKDYNDWRKPKIVSNALELLDKEIPLYKDKIKFVHLCFMSDPFMYDDQTKTLFPTIKDMTLKIIEKLNNAGIRVTTLTKGFYPDELIKNDKLLKSNEYGITLVSLNKKFKDQFEPFSSPYRKRIDSLKKLADAGLNTWVSMEPYPIPEYDNDAEDIEKVLNEIKFVKKIVFGKLNYKKLTMEKSLDSNSWANSDDFYREMSQKVINFCKKNKIQYHIKTGTPLSNEKQKQIF